MAAFAKQTEALQGLWMEQDKETMQWYVEGETAFMVWKGRRNGRKFALKESPEGELIWGSGKFVLDSSFKSGNKSAAWQLGKDRSKVAFTWVYVGAEPPSEDAEAESAPKGKGKKGKAEEAQKGKGKGKKGEVQAESAPKGKGKKGKAEEAQKGKGKKGKAEEAQKGKGKGKKGEVQGSPERRIDYIDGTVYTYEEMAQFYSRWHSRMEIMAYFQDCSLAVNGAGKGKAESGTKGKGKGKGKSAEPAAKGKSYSQVAAKGIGKASSSIPNGKGGKGASQGFGKGDPVAKGGGKGSGVERRIDKADGLAYTWEELRAFYASTYTKKETEAYWEQLRPQRPRVTNNGITAKGDSKGKSSGKATGKGKTKSTTWW